MLWGGFFLLSIMSLKRQIEGEGLPQALTPAPAGWSRSAGLTQTRWTSISMLTRAFHAKTL